MEYRDITYDYELWTTYSGKEADCYSCSDKRLLEGLSFKYISSKTEDEMKQQIDNYIDLRPTLLKAVEKERVAVQDFYEKLKYKGD